MQLLNFDVNGLLAGSLVWMTANEKLAGWAQAFGATIAILIAIAVPAWQRHAQTLDARREAAQLNLALAASLRFILNDTNIFLKGIFDLASLPRSQIRDDIRNAEFIGRISALEQREVSHARINSLYAVRGIVMIANRVLCYPAFQESQLRDDELSEMQALTDRLKDLLAIAEFDADWTLAKCRSISIAWPGRPIAYLISAGIIWNRHRRLPLKDRMFGTN